VLLSDLYRSAELHFDLTEQFSYSAPRLGDSEFIIFLRIDVEVTLTQNISNLKK
jgi:hypothetical protein